MNIHSSFLVHWTGKCFAGIADEGLRRAAYVDRLWSICEKGLYLAELHEEVHGFGGAFIEIASLGVCFTEIKLSMAEDHAKRYGKLGIGFAREDLMFRGANPVFYVPNSDNGAVNTNIPNLANLLHQKCTDPQIRSQADVLLGYVKPLGKYRPGSWDFEYYDELEWRIQRLSLGGEMMDYFYNVGDGQGEQRFALRLPKEKGLVKLLVFPDKPTEEQAFNDLRISSFFKDHMPIRLTLEACEHF